jgi:hypothetical protein
MQISYLSRSQTFHIVKIHIKSLWYCETVIFVHRHRLIFLIPIFSLVSNKILQLLRRFDYWRLVVVKFKFFESCKPLTYFSLIIFCNFISVSIFLSVFWTEHLRWSFIFSFLWKFNTLHIVSSFLFGLLANKNK